MGSGLWGLAQVDTPGPRNALSHNGHRRMAAGLHTVSAETCFFFFFFFLIPECKVLYSGSQQTRKLLLSGTMHAVSISSLKARRLGGQHERPGAGSQLLGSPGRVLAFRVLAKLRERDGAGVRRGVYCLHGKLDDEDESPSALLKCSRTQPSKC